MPELPLVIHISRERTGMMGPSLLRLKISDLFRLREQRVTAFLKIFFGAADLGYGISTNGGTGGFYYQPKVGYKTETMDVFGFYKGISRDGSTVSSFGVGAAFRF